MADLLRPDLCIVGAGALGLALASHARQLGASVVLVDRGIAEPGDGPDQAVRLAALQASAAHAQAVRQGATLGFAAAEPKTSLRTLKERLDHIASARAPLDSPERLAALGIEVVHGQPNFIDGQTLGVGEQQIRAGRFLLALGASPSIPPVPGLDEIEIFTPDSILGATRKLSHLLVVGGDPVAYALAQVFRRLGSDVTLVPNGAALPGFDREAADVLVNLLQAEGVRIIAGGTLVRIQPRSQGIGATVAMASGETEALDVSHVLVAETGEADLSALNMEAARLRPRPKASTGLAHGPLGQTSKRRIRLVGASAGLQQWPHALRHGRAVVESLVLGAPRAGLAPQPLLVLTDPQLAQIGEPDAKASGIFRASLAENEKALATGAEAGLVKVVTGKGGTISGASVLGAQAAELAAVLALAMERKIPLASLADLSLPHPSLFSAITVVAENYRASRPVSAWTGRRQALRRLIPR